MAKSKVAKFKSRKTKNANTKNKAKKNPNSADSANWSDLGMRAGAGFAGYTATKVLARVAYSQAVKKFPNAATHASVAASIMGAVGAYFGTQKWDKISDYHEEITLGSAIAAIQSAVQAYLPQYAWVVGDLSPEQYGAKKAKGAKEAEEAQGTGQYQSTVPSLPGVPDEIPHQPAPQQLKAQQPQQSQLSENDWPDHQWENFMKEHGLEEADEIGKLPPKAAPLPGGITEEELDSFGFGSLGDGGDGLGDFNDAQLH